MARRYKLLNNRMSKNGTKKLETAYYNEIASTNSDIIVLTQAGDRFDLLAHQFYGDPQLWWYIAKANNMKFNALEAGIKIRIPASSNGAFAVESKDITYLDGDETTHPTSGDYGN
tara:strand:+ start:25 stop:369 length:345 start_codon:yes stop_codon:yes gene_type:complete